MLAVSRCTDLPQLEGDAANCIQYKGYKRAGDGDPPAELTSHVVKWVKRHHKQCADAHGGVTWAMGVVYTQADGVQKELHKTPCYFEDRNAVTHARVYPHVRGQCSRRCAAPPHLATQCRTPTSITTRLRCWRRSSRTSTIASITLTPWG